MVTTEIKKLSVAGKNLFEFFPFAAQQVYLLLFAKDASTTLRLNLALENIPGLLDEQCFVYVAPRSSL